MTPEQFVYWLQGFFEITEVDNEVDNTVYLTEEQVKVIRNHLSEVLNQPPKVTSTQYPSWYPSWYPSEIQSVPTSESEDVSPLISWNSTNEGSG